MLAERIQEFFKYRERSVKVVNRKPRDEGIFSVGARFASAKKGKICPFIEVAD